MIAQHLKQCDLGFINNAHLSRKETQDVNVLFKGCDKVADIREGVNVAHPNLKQQQEEQQETGNKCARIVPLHKLLVVESV